MDEAAVLDILRQSLWTALIVSTPILAVALIVGLAIGLVQALTSVQEMTLTFVPKLGAILAVFWMTMSFSGHTLVRFYQDQVIPMVIGRLGTPPPTAPTREQILSTATEAPI
jgi:flagellar biosynthetic protein FliQ